MRIKNINKEHQNSLSFNDRLALYITNHVGTMVCAYVFAGIGIGSLAGVISGNTLLALLFGSISSYFLQLVLLPLIMVGQNLQNRHTELRAEHEYQLNVQEEKQNEEIIHGLKEIILEIKNQNKNYIGLRNDLDKHVYEL